MKSGPFRLGNMGPGLGFVLLLFLAYYGFFLGAGYGLKLINFTSATNRFHPDFKASLWSKFFLLFLANTLLLEPLFRGLLLQSLIKKLSPVWACLLTSMAYSILMVPIWFLVNPPQEALAWHEGIVFITLLSLSASILYLAFNSIWVPALWMTLIYFIEVYILNDADSNLIPFGYYVSSSPHFYLLKYAAPVVQFLLLLVWTRNLSLRALNGNLIQITRWLGQFLFLLGGYTLIIKFFIPVTMALQEGEPLTHYIMWDFWWVAHWILGYGLLHPKKLRWLPGQAVGFALLVSTVEIVIVVTKFVLFSLQPEITYWTVSWFVNKIFVLACFISLLKLLLRREVREYLRG